MRVKLVAVNRYKTIKRTRMEKEKNKTTFFQGKEGSGKILALLKLWTENHTGKEEYKMWETILPLYDKQDE